MATPAATLARVPIRPSTRAWIQAILRKRAADYREDAEEQREWAEDEQDPLWRQSRIDEAERLEHAAADCDREAARWAA